MSSPADLSGDAARLAGSLASGPTLAYAAIRRSLAYGAAHSFEEALSCEAEMMAHTGGSDDHRRAVTAFLAKQRPTFEGR